MCSLLGPSTHTVPWWRTHNKRRVWTRRGIEGIGAAGAGSRPQSRGAPEPVNTLPLLAAVTAVTAVTAASEKCRLIMVGDGKVGVERTVLE